MQKINLKKFGLVLIAIFSIIGVSFFSLPGNINANGGITVTFNAGIGQSWVVPANVTSITVDAAGAEGGTHSGPPIVEGGLGGRVQGTMTVIPGTTLYIDVGNTPTTSNFSTSAGLPGGGAAGTGRASAQGNPGGGMTWLSTNPSFDTSTVTLVAGGGGGACALSDTGGDGGGNTGGNGSGTITFAGFGGTQTGGGAVGSSGIVGSAGTAGQGGAGGNGTKVGGGGGGGGYYGGGGGSGLNSTTSCGAGGGGSSYLSPSLTGASTTSGYETGNGYLKIIYQTNITVTAATNTKVYDGTKNAAATPTITGGALNSGDIANFTETYDNKNVGNNKTLTPSGTVADGNGGNNYAITFVNDTTGSITALPLTVTATGINKVYDGTNIATVSLATNALAGDTVTASGTATFDDAAGNVGTGKNISVTGITLNGADAGNYSLTNTTATTTADITPNSATVTLDNSNLSRTYNASPQVVNVVSTNPTSLSTSVTYNGSATAPTDPGTYTVVAAVTDPNYSGTDTQILTITKANQTITFAPLSDKDFGATDFTISATSNSSLPVSFTTSSTACSVSGTTVHLITKGSCAITASQTGNIDYNAATPTTQTFTVIDNTKPVITLLGSSTVNLAIGDTYTDAGATATDDVDGNITSNIVTVNPVDTSIPNTYTITYNISDSSGNAATQVTRTVVVAGASGSTGGTSGGSSSSGSGASTSSGSTSGSTSGGSSSPASTGSSGASSVTPTGQVLGAETGPTVTVIPGCSGTTGFSTVTGQSCVNNSVTTTPTIGQVLGAETFHFTLKLKMGSTGNEVTELQKFLTTMGYYYTGKIDGKFGLKTKGAVIKLEIANKLTPDGIVGPKVRAILNA